MHCMTCCPNVIQCVYMIEYNWYNFNTITLLWAHGANTLFWCERCGRLDSVFPRFACLQSCSLSKGSSAALPPVTDNRPWQSSVTSCRVVDVIQLSTIEHDFSLLSGKRHFVTSEQVVEPTKSIRIMEPLQAVSYSWILYVYLVSLRQIYLDWPAFVWEVYSIHVCSFKPIFASIT